MFQCGLTIEREIGSSISFVSFDTYERLGKPGSIKAFNSKVLAANSSMFQKLGSVDIKIQMKPKSGDIARNILITADNCLPCLLGWGFMIEEIGEQLLYSTKHRTALPISAETTTGVRTFAIAEKNARFPSRQEKLVEIFIKDENGTALSSP